MKSKMMPHWPVFLAMIGIMMPQSAFAVQPLPTTVDAIQDVALDTQGALRGQLLDSSGKPVAATPLQFRRQGETVATMITDPAGRFVVHRMRAGVYELRCGEIGQVYRVWTAGSPPPAAKPSLLLVKNQTVVRGQGGPWAKYLLMSGLIAAAGVIGGVIGYNVRDVDSAS